MHQFSRRVRTPLASIGGAVFAARANTSNSSRPRANTTTKRSFCSSNVVACATKYRLPPEPLRKLQDAPPGPSLSFDPSEKYVLLLGNLPSPSVEEISRKKLKLAGISFDPQLHLPARAGWHDTIEIKQLFDSNNNILPTPTSIPLKGLPVGKKIRMRSFHWSPSQNGKATILMRIDDGKPELWLLEINEKNGKSTASIRPLVQDRDLFGIRGSPATWHRDGKQVLVSVMPENAKAPPKKAPLPDGPVIQEADGSSKGGGRTHTNLLKDVHHENLYEYHTTSEVFILDLESNKRVDILPADMWRSLSVSPDGNFLLASRTVKPFSYSCPDSRFSQAFEVFYFSDDRLHIINRELVYTRPIQENLPSLFDVCYKGYRSFNWKFDRPNSLRFTEALDGGHPKTEVEHRDQVSMIHGPPYIIGIYLPYLT